MIVVYDFKILDRRLAQSSLNEKIKLVQELIKRLELLQTLRGKKIKLLIFLIDGKSRYKSLALKLGQILKTRAILIETGQNRWLVIRGIISSLIKNKETQESFLMDYLSEKEIKRVKNAEVVFFLDKKLRERIPAQNNCFFY